MNTFNEKCMTFSSYNEKVMDYTNKLHASRYNKILWLWLWRVLTAKEKDYSRKFDVNCSMSSIEPWNTSLLFLYVSVGCSGSPHSWCLPLAVAMCWAPVWENIPFMSLFCKWCPCVLQNPSMKHSIEAMNVTNIGVSCFTCSVLIESWTEKNILCIEPFTGGFLCWGLNF